MGRKHGVLTPQQRSAALLSIEGFTGQEIATKLESNRVWVTNALNKPHVIKFRQRQEEKLCDKIADNLVIDMSASLGFLNEHLLEHVKSIHDIGAGELVRRCPVCEGSGMNGKKGCHGCDGTSSDIGKGWIELKGVNPATRLRANESFCKMAGMSFKEKENKTEKLPDIKVDMEGYENEKKETG